MCDRRNEWISTYNAYINKGNSHTDCAIAADQMLFSLDKHSDSRLRGIDPMSMESDVEDKDPIGVLYQWIGIDRIDVWSPDRYSRLLPNHHLGNKKQYRGIVYDMDAHIIV